VNVQSTVDKVLTGTVPSGTANGVLFLNGSKVVTSGSALTFDGTKAISFGDGSSATLTVPYLTNGNTFTVKHGAGADTRLVFTSSGFASGNSVSFETWNGSAYNSVALSGANTAIFTLAGTEQMRLTSTGLGIGTSSPSNKLVVSNAGANGLEINPTSGVSSGASLNGYNRSTVAFTPLTYTGLAHYFQTGSSPATTLTLDSSGNLGLGVTPSAWGSVIKPIEINRAGNFVGAPSNAAAIHLGANVRFDGDWKYANTEAANLYTVENNVFMWRIAPSGTAGNAISFTQAMTLTAGGNLLVGTTTDAGRLTVSGKIRTIGGDIELDSGQITTNSSANPLLFGVNATERARINNAGNFSIGGTADRATTVGTKALNVFDGTAPVGTLANGISLYSDAGEAYVMDAAGNATLISPHDSETNEWIFRSKHTPTGKVLRIDVERLLRFVNDHFGLDAVEEFVER
jgi:hypothetical protein